jgi:AAA domain
MTNPNGHGADTAPPGTFTRDALSYTELLTIEVAPLRPLVDGTGIDEGTGVILAGPPNVGKTWLVLSLARAVASGRPWLGRFNTNQAGVLIFDEESHVPGLQQRLRMLEATDPSEEPLPIHFCIGHGVRLDSQDGVSHVEAMIAKHRPGLTIMDSFTRIHGASENDAGEMAAVFAVPKALMRQYKTAFLFTDHIRKKSLLNEPEEMLRGSTEKRAWPDSILFAAPGEGNQIRLGHLKSRYGRRFEPFAVTLDMDESAGSARLSYAGAVASDAVTKGNEIIAAIHELRAEFGDDGADAATVAAWLDCSPDTVRRHVGKLVASGLVGTRKVTPSAKGGKPKDVYDVVGGRD